MNWEITYQKNLGILWVKAFGPMNLAQLKSMGCEAITQATQLDTYRTLVDLRLLVPTLSTEEIIHLPEQLAQAGMRRTSKIALLGPADPLLLKSLQLFVALTVRLGYMMRVFRTPGDALAWLAGINASRDARAASPSTGQTFDSLLQPMTRRRNC